MELRRKLEAREFAVLAEMEPPKGADVQSMKSAARRVKGKVDAFIVPEMSSAVMRMSSLGGALVLRDEGLECVIQACCRDRNRLAIQGDLLAAWALGIPSVMAVTGEDPSAGDHHQTRAVNDIDLVELLQVIDGLKNGRDMAGIELAGATDFLVGTTAGFGSRGKSPERPGPGFSSPRRCSTWRPSGLSCAASKAARPSCCPRFCCSNPSEWPATSPATCRIFTFPNR